VQTVKKKPSDQLWEGLITNLTYDLFEEEEIEEVVKDIEALDTVFRQKVLALSASLAQSASGLVPNVLRRIKIATNILSPKDMERWITHAFNLLESRGMDAFFQFLSKTDEEDLQKFKSIEGLHLQTISSLLETYLRAISGIELKIAPGEESYTDTDTVFIPYVFSQFKEYEMNFLLFKLMTVHYWAQITQNSLDPDPALLKPFFRNTSPDHEDIEHLFELFDDKRLALDLYNLLDAFRLETFLRRELPGLMRMAESVKRELYKERPLLQDLQGKSLFVEGLYQYFLKGVTKGVMSGPLEQALPMIDNLRKAETPQKTLEVLFSLYNIIRHLDGEYQGSHFHYLGSIKPEKVSLCLRAKRQAMKKQLESTITKLINMPDFEIERLLRKRSFKEPIHNKSPKKDAEYFLIRGKLFELDQESKELIQEIPIYSDGILFDGSSVVEGNTIICLKELIGEESEENSSGGFKYDEWDYRRSDYKKGWCTLFELDTPPGDEPFVELTIKRYGGYIKTLRRKFELLRKELKLLRRQREGDHIDIDAIIEAFADMKAGLSPSQNLFVKFDRQARNIAALFLLDMSGSTKGWVNRAEKEALVLMCEALEAIGDRYAIYGFSGCMKDKCEFYKIKGFDEHYGQAVKRRIAGIVPKDYTRMGPPIRHSTCILKKIDARVKLLVTLSDGHPEDRVGYRGDYAIEDTRKALIEAKEQGIQPFCITIDKEARSYLPHMFGEVSYIVLDDVRKLPNKITEIYRKLTT